MASPFIGKDTVLQLSISSVFTSIADVISISGFSASVSTVETTVLTSSARTRIAGIPDWGNVSFSIRYNPGGATHAALTDLITTPAVASWKIIFTNTDASVYAFSGILTKFDVKNIEVDGDVQADCEIEISGAVTITV